MPRTTLRCIGGSQHGQLLNLASDLRTYRVAKHEPPRFDKLDSFNLSLQTETYERRNLSLFGSAMEYLVLNTLSDRAVGRALADFIEGVER